MEYPEFSWILLMYILAWLSALWIVIPIHIANIAKRKGYDFWYWFLISIMINIFALLIVIGLKDKNLEKQRNLQFEEIQKLNKNLERLLMIEENDAKVRDILVKIK